MGSEQSDLNIRANFGDGDGPRQSDGGDWIDWVEIWTINNESLREKLLACDTSLIIANRDCGKHCIFSLMIVGGGIPDWSNHTHHTTVYCYNWFSVEYFCETSQRHQSHSMTRINCSAFMLIRMNFPRFDSMRQRYVARRARGPAILKLFSVTVSFWKNWLARFAKSCFTNFTCWSLAGKH